MFEPGLSRSPAGRRSRSLPTPRLPFARPDLAGRDPRWVLLYAVTLALQGLCGFLRAVVLVVPVGIAFKIAGFLPLFDQLGGIPVSGVCFVLGFGPLVYSVVSLIRPIGAGSYWRAQLGGRAPSDREREIFDDVLDGLRESDPGMRVPKSWFVIDDVRNTNGAVLGDTLMLSTGTLMDVSLEAVVAHEVGHLTAIDARLTVALNRLALPANLFVRLDEALGEGCLITVIVLVGWIVSGELALNLLRPFWDAWFRAREFKADQYAARLGWASDLADLLEREALLDDRPIPFRFLSGASHPPTEHRIQALRDYDRHQQQTALP